MPNIGDILKVYAIVAPENDIQGNRYLNIDTFTEPCYAWYVGYTFKFTGKYDPGGYVRQGWDEPPDHEPPSLRVKESHLVYRIRFHPRGKEHHCLPHHTKIILTTTKEPNV